MHPTRQKLLDTGLAIATEKGLRGLTVRELAAAAEVNLGSFVYHFGNRDAFIEELVELWYAPLYDELKSVAAKGYLPLCHRHVRSDHGGTNRVGGPSERLYQPPVWRCAGRGRGGPALFCSVCRAVIPLLLLELVRKAQAEGSLVAGHPLQLMIFIMGSVALPLVITGNGRQLGWLPETGRPVSEPDRQPRSRQTTAGTWALRGLRPSDMKAGDAA